MKLPFLCALLAIAAQAQIVSPKFKEAHRQIHTVLVLPADVSMHLVTLKGGRSLPEQSDRVGESIYAAISKELQARGAAVLPNPLGDTPTDEAKYALADLQRKFDTISVQLFRKPHGLEKGRYTLGDFVSAYAPGVPADTLVFIRGAGSESSEGKQALGWATMRPSPNAFMARVSFVDARSGEVLALARVVFWRDVAKKSEESLRSGIRDAFYYLPLPLAKAPPLK